MEKLDNWELVIKGEDLDANNQIKLEDAERNCAFVREIGTDEPSTITFGVEDLIYTKINKLIAPYYKSDYNMNRMQYSQVRDGGWKTTGFELPIPIDTDITINGLSSGKRVYIKGTLFKNVLRPDHAINQYLRARMVEVPYKKLHPVLYENVEIPAGPEVTNFNLNKKFVLRTDDVVNPKMVEWDATSPHYSIVPEKNTKYVFNNPIEVLFTHDQLDPKDIIFRVWYDGTEDLKVKPRLDHMFLPPNDGKTRWVEDTINISGNQIKSMPIDSISGTGYNVGVTLSGEGGVAYTESGVIKKGRFAPGMVALMHQSGQGEVVKINEVQPGNGSSEVWLARLENTYTPADASLYAPVAHLGQPLEPVDFKNLPSGIFATVDPATGQMFATGSNANTAQSGVKACYYRFKIGAGKEIFTMKQLEEKYRLIEDPHKLTFMFENKGNDITETGTVTLYTLSQFYRTTPPEVKSSVDRTLSAVSRAGISI